MKKCTGLLSLTLTMSLGYSCSKNDSDKAPEPGDTASPVGPVPPVIPSSPPPPNTSIQPDTPPLPPDDIANNGELKLSPLPANGVPVGYLNWDEFNMKDPESRSLLVFDGTDPVKEEFGEDPLCSVYVLAAYLNAKSQATYILRTSFKHNDQSHAWISVSLKQGETSVTGKGSNDQDEIFLQLAQANELLSATRMNLKWFHINHFDTGVCEKLKPRAQS